MLFIDTSGFMAVDGIKSHLFGLTWSKHLGHQFSPHPPGSVGIDGRGDYFV